MTSGGIPQVNYGFFCGQDVRGGGSRVPRWKKLSEAMDNSFKQGAKYSKKAQASYSCMN
jgi:hypothetical protein